MEPLPHFSRRRRCFEEGHDRTAASDLGYARRHPTGNVFLGSLIWSNATKLSANSVRLIERVFSHPCLLSENQIKSSPILFFCFFRVSALFGLRSTNSGEDSESRQAGNARKTGQSRPEKSSLFQVKKCLANLNFITMSWIHLWKSISQFFFSLFFSPA